MRKRSEKELIQRAEYQKVSVLNKTVNFNRNVDVDLIPHIETGINFSAYIKTLIRSDIKKKNPVIKKYKDGD